MAALLVELDAALRDALPAVPQEARRRVLAALCRRCGGERLYVPTRPPGAAAARVQAAIAAGATIAEAAASAGVSARHARRLRAAGRT